MMADAQKRERVYRNVGWALFGLAVTVAAGCALWFWPQRLSDPLAGRLDKEGGLPFPGGARAALDENGFWSIRADNEADALYALGFVHAHDRLFQMDMARRNGGGTLSEVLGSATIETDRLNRSYGYKQIALQDLSTEGWLSRPENAELRDLLSRYIDGVNAYVDSIQGQFWYWPPEYRIFRSPPQKFTLVDVMLSLASMHLYFNGSRLSELSNTFALQRMRDHLPFFFGGIPASLPTAESYLSQPLKALGNRQSSNLFPQNGHPSRTNADPAQGHLPPQLLRALGTEAVGQLPALALTGQTTDPGSNAFVCAGNRTTSQAPLLANDPHLGLGLPGFLYPTRIETPTHSSVGVYIPLVPFPVIGFSEHGAWGMTYSEIDQSDFYTVDLDAPKIAGASSFRFGSSWRALETREEKIVVRGSDPVTFTVGRTPYGPILEIPAADQEQVPLITHLAVADVTLKPGNTNALTLYRLSRARDVKSFREAITDHVAPPQNVHWAGTDGGVAWGLAGRLVVRDWTPAEAIAAALPGTPPDEIRKILADAPVLAETPGALILPLREPFIWSGTEPAASFVFSTSFAQGCFGNANEPLTTRTQAFPSLASADWATGLRSSRIKELLNQTPLHSPASFRDMQLDTRDNMAALALPIILTELKSAAAAQKLNSDAQELASRMEKWDLHSRAVASEPLLFDHLLNEWRSDVFSALGNPELADILRRRGKHNARMVLSWLSLLSKSPTSLTGKTEESSPATLLRQALVQTANQLRPRLEAKGISWERSTWGQFHTFGPSHPLSALPVLGSFFRYPALAADGSTTSVRVQAPRHYLSSEDLTVAHGAGLRMIVSPTERKALMMFPSGASGVPGDARFRANHEAYNNGEYFTVHLHPGPSANVRMGRAEKASPDAKH